MNQRSYAGNNISHSNHHSHPSNNTNACTWLLFFLLAISTVLSALVALFYLLEEFLDSIERFIYDEGWSKASVSIVSMFLGAFVSSVFAVIIAMMPIITLSLVASTSNPLVIAVLAGISLMLIGARLTCFLANLAYDKLITSNNSDAISPVDSRRYAITAQQEKKLIEQHNLNPIKVKCAIIALHEKIGEQSVPSLLVRFFTEKGQKKQRYLDQIRKLRTGQLEDISIDDRRFNLRNDKNDFNNHQGQQTSEPVTFDIFPPVLFT